MSKFYAVKKGRNPGVYTSWEDCKEEVTGFSGASYKSFPTRKEAEAFVGDNGKSQERESPVKSEKLQDKIIKGTRKLSVYLDGSHFKHVANGHLGIGAFCEYEGKEYKMSCPFNQKLRKYYEIAPDASISNPTMELASLSEFLRMLYQLKVKDVDITFLNDYIGVEKWMTGEWKAKEKHIQNIKKKCDFFLEFLKQRVSYQHVPGHSNVYGNDQADVLAKSTVFLNTFPDLFEVLRNEAEK